MDEKIIRKVPFYKPSLDEAEIEAVRSTLADGWITTGPKAKKFEAEMAAYVGSKYALAVNSCTAALHLALAAAGIKKGDKVVTTAYTFAATVETIIWCGATPVLVDIDSRTLNIDPEQVAKKTDKKTKALVAVDIAGLPCEYDSLQPLAKRKKLFLLADAAHSLGAVHRGVQVGQLADATAFSFYSTKNLTTGEGGMLVTDNQRLHKKAAILALHGMSKDAWKRYTSEGSWYYEIVAAGFKYNLSDLQASLGLAQLEKFPRLQERRKYLAGLYDRYLTPYLDMLEPPPRNGHSQHAWHMYLIRLKPKVLKIGRNELLRQLTACGIGASVHFIPVHLHPFYRKFLRHKPGDFPNALATYKRIFTPPFYPAMSDEEVLYVCSTLGDILKANYKSALIPVGAKKKAELVG
ncbi:MAG: DegT/DnrJ/EryC1/StrS aminotransferase family protein [candidate division Zixibacteria bacterium]|nr:DegT/DnrJ/EryC1/StrS aminotransferase family protein [candidate division Zixibacteria bacterium]